MDFGGYFALASPKPNFVRGLKSNLHSILISGDVTSPP